MSAVVFLTSDLHWSSRVLGLATALGATCKILMPAMSLAGAIESDCRLVLVDLVQADFALAEMVAAIRSAAPAARIVAFGPHVDEGLLQSAEKAGCDLVLSRSQFHKQYVELVQAAAGLGVVERRPG